MGMDEWTSAKTPPEPGRYLTICKGVIPPDIHDVLSYTNNLKSVDRYAFGAKKPGWYSYDSEWGYYEVDNVEYWMPLPEPPKDGDGE